jgi:hypothetical protein
VIAIFLFPANEQTKTFQSAATAQMKLTGTEKDAEHLSMTIEEPVDQLEILERESSLEDIAAMER